MKKLILCILLFICLSGVNVSADNVFTIKIDSYTYTPSDLNVEGLSYDSSSNTLTISKSFNNIEIVVKSDLNLKVIGDITLSCSDVALKCSNSNVYLELDANSSLTIAGGKPYLGQNPIYKAAAKNIYNKNEPFICDYEFNKDNKAYTGKPIKFDKSKVDFSNLAEIDDSLTLINITSEGEVEGGTFESVKGFIVANDVVKTVNYLNNVYTLELKDFGDEALFIELLFKGTEINDTLEKDFVTSDLSNVVSAPSSTYDIEELTDKVMGSMYKDSLGNYYYSYYITMAKKDDVNEYEDFSMRLKDINGKFKYINVKFKKSEIIPPPTNNDIPENDDYDEVEVITYKVPNTCVR